MRLASLNKALSAGLSVSILLCAPGLVPYQALAATIDEGAGPARILPQAAATSAPGLEPLKTPELPASLQLPSVQIPGASAEGAAPEAQAPQAQAPTVMAGTEKLAAAAAPGANADAGVQQASLEHAYTAGAAASSAGAVEGKDEGCSGGGCPFAGLFGKSKRSSAGGGSNDAAPAPARPAPSDVGWLHKAAMYGMAYTWKTWDRAIGARWDKMPPVLAAVYLYFNEQYLRLHMWDASTAPSTETKTYGAATQDQKKFRTADGSYFDLKDPGMAAANTRFNHLRKPEGMPNPDWEKMEPNPYVISQELQQRAHDAQGNPVIKEIPANSWFTQIQPQLHDWFNHEQEPLSNNPVSFTVPKGHPLKPEGGSVLMNRTKTDPSVPTTYKGAAVHRNGETSPWDRSDLYGSSQETQDKVRAHEGGRLKLGADGWLPTDPAKPGVPQTGFNNNMSMTLAMNNVVMAREHNLVADAINREYKARGVQLTDEELFQKARLRMTGFNARNHTVPWTQWLFAGSQIGQEIMWADWYGFVNKRFKLAYMRWTDRHPALAKFTDPFVRTELLFGIPGTNTTHYGKHYNFTEEFVDVYRMHQLIRDTYKVHHLETNPDGTVEISVIDTMKLRDLAGVKTQDALRKHSFSDWALTMGKENVGELTINNVPDDLRDLAAQDGAKDGHKVDLGAIDIMRTRERLAASTYVKFTMRLGEKPPRTFEELAGGDKEKADKLRAVYKSINDVDFQIGILAERKPVGYALGNRQFKVFVLSAPARLKNDRFLSSEYNAKTYDQSGIDYMETNNWGNLVARHAPELKALDIEAMRNPYMTYPEPGWLPKALSQDNLKAEGELAKTAKRGAFVIAASALGAGYALVAGAPILGAAAVVAAALAALSIYKRKQAVDATAALKAQDERERSGKPVSVLEDFSLGATNAKLFDARGLNEAEFERVFRDFGALRGYVTAYDLARLREADAVRAAKEGRGTRLSRLKARMADKARDEKLIALYADRVVWEDGMPGGRVPAISEARLREVLEASRPRDAEALNQRLHAETERADDRLTNAGYLSAALSIMGAVSVFHTALSPVAIGLLAALPLFGAIASMVLRMTAKADLFHATTSLSKPFRALFSGVKDAQKSARWSRVGALAAMDLGGMLAWKIAHADPLAAAALALASLSGWLIWVSVKSFLAAVELQRAAVYGTLKQGAPQTPVEELPGKTALEKHGRYFSGGKEVAKFWTTYHYVRAQGLGVFKSLTTAASWHLFFSGKTQKNMTAEERAKFKPGKFDNYIPNFADAQGPTNTRIFSMTGQADGTKRGDVDMKEFERLFAIAGGRDYLTKKDLSRIWYANAERDQRTTNWLSRKIGKIAFDKRFNQLFAILADRVVNEDGAQVQAISRAGLLRYYQGAAPYDLLRQRGGAE